MGELAMQRLTLWIAVAFLLGFSAALSLRFGIAEPPPPPGTFLTAYERLAPSTPWRAGPEGHAFRRIDLGDGVEVLEVRRLAGGGRAAEVTAADWPEGCFRKLLAASSPSAPAFAETAESC